MQLRNAGIDPNRLPAGAKIDGWLIDAAEEPAKRSYAPYRSKLELLWAQELECQRTAGDIAWWFYEPCSLVIADVAGQRCRFTPDFMVVCCGDYKEIIWYETKGFLREAARIRFLAAKGRYPFWTFRLVRRDWKTGRWIITETP